MKEQKWIFIKPLEGLKFLSLESVEEIAEENIGSFISVAFPNCKVVSGFSIMNHFSVSFSVTLRGV